MAQSPPFVPRTALHNKWWLEWDKATNSLKKMGCRRDHFSWRILSHFRVANTTSFISSGFSHLLFSDCTKRIFIRRISVVVCMCIQQRVSSVILGFFSSSLVIFRSSLPLLHSCDNVDSSSELSWSLGGNSSSDLPGIVVVYGAWLAELDRGWTYRFVFLALDSMDSDLDYVSPARRPFVLTASRSCAVGFSSLLVVVSCVFPFWRRDWLDCFVLWGKGPHWKERGKNSPMDLCLPSLFFWLYWPWETRILMCPLCIFDWLCSWLLACSCSLWSFPSSSILFS